jgi:formylglycine-generating enzyme required for sulfatase activity
MTQTIEELRQDISSKQAELSAALAKLDASVTDENFVPVPEMQFELEDGTIHTEPAFLIGAYLNSKGDAGQIVIDPKRMPWTGINYYEADEICEANGLPQVTETQWLAMALNAYHVAENWTGGAVGEGSMFQGIRNGGGARPGEYVPTDKTEQRWLRLSNGSRICDINGNVLQWVKDNLHGDKKGLIAKKITLASPSIALAPHPSLTKGMGWRPSQGVDWSSRALLRGGYWGSGDYAGAFRLGVWNPVTRGDSLGFRSTKPSSGL